MRLTGVRAMISFGYVQIETLARQLRLSPTELRRREIERAEELASEIDENKEYPYEYVYHQITGTQIPPNRLGAKPQMLSGRKLLGDLAALIVIVSDSLDMKLADLPEAVDPCGENGEFHTFVYDGPLFTRRIMLEKGEKVLRDDRFYYCDLIPFRDGSG